MSLKAAAYITNALPFDVCAWILGATSHWSELNTKNNKTITMLKLATI
jgi:hypothetical protein